MTNYNRSLSDRLIEAFCKIEIPHLKGYTATDYARTYPELYARASEHARASANVIRAHTEPPQEVVERAYAAFIAQLKKEGWSNCDHRYIASEKKAVAAAIEAAMNDYAGGNTERHESAPSDAGLTTPHQLGDALNTAPPAPDNIRWQLDPNHRVEFINSANPGEMRLPSGYALVRTDCAYPPLPNEKKGFLWVTENEYRAAHYDVAKDGRKLPIYYVTKIPTPPIDGGAG